MSDTVWFSLLGVVVLGPLFAAYSIRRWGARTVLLAMILVAYLMPQTQVETPFDTRSVGLGLALVLFLGSLLGGKGGATPTLSRTTFFALGFILMSSTWSIGSSSSTLEQAVTMLAMMCLVSVPFEQRDLRRAITVAFLALLLTAAFVYATDPASWWAFDRLRGPMINANNLGLATVLCFPVLRESHRLAHFPVSAAALAVVTLTGSRAALIALGVQVLLSSWVKLRAFGRIVSIAVAGLAAASLLPALRTEVSSQGAGSESVLRSNNSRITVWAESWSRVQDHPWFGGGLGALTSDFETGSSLFAVWIISGVVGVTLVALALGSTVIKGLGLRWMGDWRMFVVLGGCINAAFEGWIVAAGTMYALVFWLAVEQIQRHAARQGERTGVSPENPSEHALPRSHDTQVVAARAAVRTRW